MTGTKKSLIASGISLAVSMALLVGSTFAWFTDSVTNKGNKIQAGSLKIGAYAYDLDKNGDKTFKIKDVNGGNAFTFEADPQDLRTDGTAIINDTDWEPGKSSAKLLQVVNEGTLATEIKLSFETSGELEGALWFDFVKVEDGQVTGKFEKRPMNTLSTFAANMEFPIINKGDTLQFILVYGMYEEAGNKYKDKDFTADVTILAKQYTYEEDGFGSSNYDEKAEYDSTVISATAENFADVLRNAEAGAEVRLTENTDNFKITLTDPQITVDLGGNTVTGQIILEQYKKDCTVTLKNGTLVSDGDYSPLIISDYAEGGSLEVVLNNMTISNPRSGEYVEGSFLYALDSYGIHSFTLNNCTVTGSLNFTDAGSVTIEGGTYTAVNGNGDIALFYLNNNNVTVNNAVLNLSGLELCDPEDWQPTLNKTQIIN